MPIDLAAETAKLNALIGAKRTPSAVAAVDNALTSKWEGMQSAALRVLGSWGDPESIAALRSFLEAAGAREFGWSIRGVAIEELARSVGSPDASWVLEHYFSLAGVLAKHEFLRVVLALPPESARKRLVSETHSASRDNRQAAMKAIGNMPFADRVDLLRPFLRDQDSEIRKGAKVLQGRI